MSAANPRSLKTAELWSRHVNDNFDVYKDQNEFINLRLMYQYSGV